MGDYINKNKVDSLKEQPLKNLINKSVIVLLNELDKYMTPYNLKEFKKGKTPLHKLGICTGVTTLIDVELNKIRKEICILDTDTLDKFKADITRDFG